MAKLVSKKDHEFRDGYILRFDNGHIYSVVDLSSFLKKSKDKKLGELYDMMGGRFEAILLPESNNGKWGDPIRARSFDEVISYVENEESNN